ncbi:hypothetical protein B0A48_03962 [Cryoendolithus antarcticus]|uniref:BZIP domain-containing protein n=1 Tax=Cryoendolithus antarcticus TaxID=1507870 RepID=A0A1V8THA5_9PEZI|nr:hypothetical protein B0A48_03962 [Cryoendolithus antarcticus]
MTDSNSQTPPPAVIVRSIPAKKRKSWGQELPEPKTALPPRKRAKTDDEKEQRRIERIKRNRAAAHNSRERKRQETDNLAVLLAHANAKLDAYHKLHGPLPASVVLPEVTLCMEAEDEPTPAPSHAASRLSYDTAGSPTSPADTVMSASPMIKREAAMDLPLSDLPLFDLLNPKSASLPHNLDAMQHSAAMLSDLQYAPYGYLDGFSLENDTYDAGFGSSYVDADFTFDEFLNEEPISFAVDQAAGAA